MKILFIVLTSTGCCCSFSFCILPKEIASPCISSTIFQHPSVTFIIYGYALLQSGAGPCCLFNIHGKHSNKGCPQIPCHVQLYYSPKTATRSLSDAINDSMQSLLWVFYRFRDLIRRTFKVYTTVALIAVDGRTKPDK